MEAYRREPGMDDSFKTLLLEHIAPGLGCIVALLMFMSPLKAVFQIRANKHLGDFNPIPLVAIIANCTGWLLYGCINVDPYVIAANEPGLLLGIFMTVSCYGFADARVRDLMLKALMFFAAVLSLEGIAIAIFAEERSHASVAAGGVAVFILLCFYASPLSTMVEVLRSRSAASLYWPSALMGTINGLLWLAYGTAVADPFIGIPNGIGAVLGLLQLALLQVFPAAKRQAEGGEAAEGVVAATAGEYEPLQGEQTV